MKKRRKSSAPRRLRFERLESRQMLSLQSALTTVLTGLAEAGLVDATPVNFVGPVLPGSYQPSDLVVQATELIIPVSDQTRPLTAKPFRLGIGGDGFFIFEGPRREQLYTRNQDFRLNERHELVTADGRRVLGYRLGADLSLDTSRLASLAVPLGTQGARATQHAFFSGVLTPLASIGDSITSHFVLYGENGSPLRVKLEVEMIEKTSVSRTQRWVATSPDSQSSTGANGDIVGNGEIVFGSRGEIISGSVGSIVIERQIAGAARREVMLHFDQVSGLVVKDNLGQSVSVLNLAKQDGFPVGILRQYIINERGEIHGIFDNRMDRLLGQIQLASFPDPYGLVPRGNGYYAASPRAGQRSTNNPGASHFGEMVHIPAGLDVQLTGPPFNARYPWELRSVRLAINGEGYFVVEDARGRRFYTRDGNFHLNTEQQLATAEGLRLLGYDANEHFQIDTGRLAPVDVPIGMIAASATRQVTLSGNLSPLTDVGDVPNIIQSEPLGDASFPFPNDPTFDLHDFSTVVAPDSSAGTALDQANYTYYLTFYNTQTGLESRPTPRLGAIAISYPNRRIRIENLPQPDGVVFNAVRIYRNVDGSRETHYLVDTLPAGTDVYIDGKPDITILGNVQVDLVGPKITANARLLDVVRWDGTAYARPFVVGTLRFIGTRGDRTLAAKRLEIDELTMAGDLVRFMEEAFGIDRSVAAAGAIQPGGAIVHGRIRFVSHLGIENRLQVELSAFTSRPTGSLIANHVALPFSLLQDPNGHGTTTDFVVFDALGSSVAVSLATVLEAKGDWGSTFRWFAFSGDNAPVPPSVATALGTGLITFDATGSVVAGRTATIEISRISTGEQKSFAFNLDFGQVVGAVVYNNLGYSNSAISVTRQDGYPPGALERFAVDVQGRITGVFDNGLARPFGQIVLASFCNPRQLRYVGNGLFEFTTRSGPPRLAQPGAGSLGTLSDRQDDSMEGNNPPVSLPPWHDDPRVSWRPSSRGSFARPPAVWPRPVTLAREFYGSDLVAKHQNARLPTPATSSVPDPARPAVDSGSDAWKADLRGVTSTLNRSVELPLAQGVRFGD